MSRSATVANALILSSPLCCENTAQSVTVCQRDTPIEPLPLARSAMGGKLEHARVSVTATTVVGRVQRTDAALITGVAVSP